MGSCGKLSNRGLKIPVSAVRFCPSAPLLKEPAVITVGFFVYIPPKRSTSTLTHFAYTLWPVGVDFMKPLGRSPSYIIRNKYSYCFRMKVPIDMQAYIGKKELRYPTTPFQTLSPYNANI